jgi:hypothetical protein
MSRMIRSLSTRWRIGLVLAAVATASLVGVLLVRAEPVPRTFAYQGVLTDDAGNPITGDHSITIRVYADASTATALCSETEVATVTNGLFRVVVGDGGCAVDPTWFTQTAPPYLGITVDTTTLSPRVPLFPVASAYQAEHAESADRLVVRYGTEEISVGGTYCSPTAPMTGSLGGYQAGKALCETACGDPAAHLCSSEEVTRSLQLGVAVPNGRYLAGIATIGAGATHGDCYGLYSSAVGDNSWCALLVTTDPVGRPHPGAESACSGSEPFLCCL